MRRHFTEPHPHMEHIPSIPLTEEELTTFEYFDTEEYLVTYEDGKTAKVKVKEPKYWIPHSKYILGNKPLSVVLISPTHENDKCCYQTGPSYDSSNHYLYF